ncbi:MAG TPA: glycosyltransferase family 39 protein [Gemmata sp.]
MRDVPAISWVVRRPLLALLTIQAGLLAWAATRHSPSIDEVGHLGAGLHSWRTGTFAAYRVNPPLVRVIATAPLAIAGIELADYAIDPVPPKRPEYDLGREFVEKHGARAFWYFTVARWACLPFALLGTWGVYRWATDVYGERAGGFAATLWVICPNVLAHAQLITPDAAAASCGALAAYAFWHWLRSPTWGAAALTGLALGLALLSKATWVLLFPLWPALWLAYRAFRPVRAGCEGRQLVSAFLLAVLVLNAGFGFEGTGVPLGEIPFASLPLTTPQPDGMRINRFASAGLGWVPSPVPLNFVLGIDVQKTDFEVRGGGYLRGEWRNADGWWYYYLYGFLVKTPVGTLVIFAASLVSTLARSSRRAGRRDEFVALAHGLAVIGFVSSQTGMNQHLRYALPALPFAFVWMGRVMAWAGPCAAGWRVAAWGAAAAAAVSSLAVYPHCLSYFNEPAGGPMGGGYHLIGSNLDWGQDLLYLKQWADEHPDARPIGLAYYGFVNPQAAGLDFVLPPGHPPVYGAADSARDGPRPGWYAVSVNFLYGAKHLVAEKDEVFSMKHPAFAYFRHFRPVATAGYSIYIFHISEDECNRVRAALGLPPFVPGADPAKRMPGQER